jgi:hypothetical protein
MPVLSLRSIVSKDGDVRDALVALLVRGRIICILSCLCAVGCGADDGAAIAYGLPAGTPVSELERLAGKPSLARTVDVKDKQDFCAESSTNVRAVEYYSPRGLAGTVWSVLGKPPSTVVVVCLDSSQRITSKHMYHH